jgi:hypothetical protein
MVTLAPVGRCIRMQNASSPPLYFYPSILRECMDQVSSEIDHGQASEAALVYEIQVLEQQLANSKGPPQASSEVYQTSGASSARDTELLHQLGIVKSRLQEQQQRTARQWYSMGELQKLVAALDEFSTDFPSPHASPPPPPPTTTAADSPPTVPPADNPFVTPLSSPPPAYSHDAVPVSMPPTDPPAPPPQLPEIPHHAASPAFALPAPPTYLPPDAPVLPLPTQASLSAFPPPAPAPYPPPTVPETFSAPAHCPHPNRLLPSAPLPNPHPDAPSPGSTLRPATFSQPLHETDDNSAAFARLLAQGNPGT